MSRLLVCDLSLSAMQSCATPLSVRHTVAARLYARGADEEQVGLLLGISDRSAVRELFPRTKPMLAQLVDKLI